MIFKNVHAGMSGEFTIVDQVQSVRFNKTPEGAFASVCLNCGGIQSHEITDVAYVMNERGLTVSQFAA